jgi:CMP-N,N'-diacetyllegionaminic acid synthase
MNILFTICGRSGSKGVKNKNLRPFLGYPLPFYTLSCIDLFAQECPEFSCEIVVNTDSKDLIKLFRDHVSLAVHYIDRDPELGLDYTPKIDVIRNSYVVMKERTNREYDMVVDLDITSPLRTAKDIVNVINRKTESDADAVFSVTESRRNPYFNMVKKSDNGYVRVIDSSYNARQEAPETFDMNASIYAYSPRFLKSGKSIFEGKCDVVEMMDTGILDIDSENDFELMEAVAQYLFEHKPHFRAIKDNLCKILSGDWML